MTAESPSRFCPGCAEAQQLLNFLSVELKDPALPPRRIIETMPLLLETALMHLFSGFDYAAQPDSEIALAMRLIAIGAERAQGLLDAQPRR